VNSIARQAADLCRQLLAFAGKGSFEVEATCMNEIINECRQLLQVSVAKKVGIRYDLVDNLPPVKVDPSQLRQILLNLVINGSDAIGGKEGSIRVATTTRNVDAATAQSMAMGWEAKPGRYAVLEVADTGCGMPEHVKARIFDPFFTTKHSGRGLGLAAVVGIIRGHHGLLDVRSKKDMGTVFCAMLPIMGDHAASNAELREKAEEPIPVGTKLWKGEGKVLFVDDEESVQLLGGRMLKALGLEVEGAGNGYDGLERFRENKDGYALVVLDVNMPRLSGIEVLKEMRVDRPKQPVLLISGYPHAVDAELLNVHTLFLQKPFTHTSFAEKVGELIDG
jgi:CheY-like chemotaxis protein